MDRIFLKRGEIPQSCPRLCEAYRNSAVRCNSQGEPLNLSGGEGCMRVKKRETTDRSNERPFDLRVLKRDSAFLLGRGVYSLP